MINAFIAPLLIPINRVGIQDVLAGFSPLVPVEHWRISRSLQVHGLSANPL
jgi:hypothetical protein